MKRRSISKLISITLAAGMATAMLLTGCGSGDAGQTASTGNLSDTGSAGTVSGGTSDAGTASGNTDNNSGSDAQGGNTSSAAVNAAKGYVFSYKGTDVVIDEDMSSVYEALGEPQSYFEAASCAFQGLDKQYNYGSFEIDTYPMGEQDLIASIYFYDDTVTTAEGVTVFSSEADMKAAYGENYTEENGEIVYTKDGMKLCFIIEGGEVTSVCYRSTALDE